MPDPLFADPRLAGLYDAFDGERDDLPHYVALAQELRARDVLDIGCGTGSFAVLAAAEGFRLTGVDPAEASLDVARAKPGAELVTWYQGEGHTIPQLTVDLVVMTGNVAQVFLTDADWVQALDAVHSRLSPGGWLVYETRRVEDRAWERWAHDADERTVAIAGTGPVHHRREVLSIDLPLVSFQHSFEFPDGTCVTSPSTLRFRTDDENRHWLAHTGFEVTEVRGAPDRPSRERVYLARRKLHGVP